jgi:carbon storage regulator
MLVLSRKPGEKVVIGGGITVTVLEVVGGRIRLGVEAPGDVRILRGELACWLESDGGQPRPDAVVPRK